MERKKIITFSSSSIKYLVKATVSKYNIMRVKYLNITTLASTLGVERNFENTT